MSDMTAQAASTWRTLANLVPALEAALEPRRTPGAVTRTTPRSKPPINITTSDLLHELDMAADFYASALLMEADLKRAPADRAGRYRLVADNAAHFTTSPQRALDFCDEAEGFMATALKIIDPPTPPAFMGPCLSACGGELRLKEGEKVARCDSCGEYAPLAAARAQLMSACQTRLMTRSELIQASRILERPVKPERLRQWVKRGRLVPVVANPERFRYADFAKLASIPEVA